MKSFPISILAINRELFQGDVLSLTVPGQDGELQVLADHTPLVALLKEGEVVVQEEKGSKRIPVAGGVLEVTAQQAVALVDVLV